MGELFGFLKEALPPAAMKVVVWSFILAFVIYRLWSSAWQLSARYKRQDAMEGKVLLLGKKVGRLQRRDKRRGFKIALLVQSMEERDKRDEETKRALDDIREILMNRGGTLHER